VADANCWRATVRLFGRPGFRPLFSDLGTEACVAADIPLLHLSTDYVFDGNQSRPYVETDAIAPLCVYGRSKAEGEAAIRGVLECHLILRTSWVYGVYGMNFLKTILRLARERDELRVVSDQRGCPTASVDIADAILCIARLMATRKAVWGTYHFAGQSATTWHGFASEIVDAQAEFTHRRPLVVAISSAEHSTPARRPANSALDSSRFVATFGIRAENWHDRIRELTAVLLTGYSGNSRGWRSHPCSA